MRAIRRSIREMLNYGVDELADTSPNRILWGPAYVIRVGFSQERVPLGFFIRILFLLSLQGSLRTWVPLSCELLSN
jgi:hypothetical protein